MNAEDRKALRLLGQLVFAHAMISNPDFMKIINTRTRYEPGDDPIVKGKKFQAEFKARVNEYTSLFVTDQGIVE